MKYGKVEWGQMEALLNKIGGEDGMLAILSGEFVIVSSEKASEHKEAPKPKKKSATDAVLDAEAWQKAYETLGFNDEAVLAEISKLVPSPEPGFWDIPVLKGVTCNKVIAAFRKLGVELSLYSDDLDMSVPKNDRDLANGSYCVRVKATVEADPQHEKKSANDLVKEEIQGITLLERLLLELAYFLVTRGHLDKDNWTLCSGSRHSDGNVPCVGWNADARKLCVFWFGVDNRTPCLRTRAMVA